MAITLSELCAKYSRFSVADPGHNEEILAFLRQVSMTTKRGGISALRGPDFFALGRAQGRRSFVILMRNDDDSLGGIAALSVSTMVVKGKVAALVYASDLRLSNALSRKTRLQFHQWYEELALRCAEIEEFEGSPFMVTSIFDENTSAVRALVDKKRAKREPLYRPLFPYQNINVVGRWRKTRGRGLGAGSCDNLEELKEFLLSNPEGSEIVWSEEELSRKLAALGLGYGDFIVARREGKICGACLPFTDEAFRRTVLHNLTTGVKWVGRMLPVLGKPGFKEGTPLRNGFLGFLKARAVDGEDRADIVAALLEELLRRQRKLPRADRCHTITVMDAQGNKLDQKLKARGFLFTRLPATLYQVVHRKNFQRAKLLRGSKRRRPDIEVGLA
jgi:hypothetical protein